MKKQYKSSIDKNQNYNKKKVNGVCLTRFHTMPHFDALKIYNCGKHCE